jgi:chromodomain-helicase-DNA-binding protein 4
LITKTEQEGEITEETNESLAFEFAKVWSANKDGLEELRDVQDEAEQFDEWERTMKAIEAERLKNQAQEVTGRGAKRKAAGHMQQVLFPIIFLYGKINSKKE